MISLNGVKQNLRDNYPSVYQSVYRFYQMTPHVKHRNAKRAEMDKEIRQKLMLGTSMRYESSKNILMTIGQFDMGHSLA